MLNIKEMIIGKHCRLRHIIRYSNSPRQHNESVAEHSYYTALYAMIMAECLTHLTINHAILLQKALLHDTDECFSGDFIRVFKRSSEALANLIEKTAKDMIPQAFDMVPADSRQHREMCERWATAKDATVEGDIVAFADFLSVLSYVFQELQSGNKAILGSLEGLEDYLASFKSRKLSRDTHFQLWYKQAQGLIWDIQKTL